MLLSKSGGKADVPVPLWGRAGVEPFPHRERGAERKLLLIMPISVSGTERKSVPFSVIVYSGNDALIKRVIVGEFFDAIANTAI